MEYYIAVTMTELQPYVIMWMNFTSIKLREKQNTKEHRLYDDDYLKFKKRQN